MKRTKSYMFLQLPAGIGPTPMIVPCAMSLVANAARPKSNLARAILRGIRDVFFHCFAHFPFWLVKDLKQVQQRHHVMRCRCTMSSCVRKKKRSVHTHRLNGGSNDIHVGTRPNVLLSKVWTDHRYKANRWLATLAVSFARYLGAMLSCVSASVVPLFSRFSAYQPQVSKACVQHANPKIDWREHHVGA